MPAPLKTRSSGASFFLMELIIAIGVFAAAAAVCVQLFAQASLAGRQSDELSRAALYAQSAAESFKAARGDLAQTAGLLSGTASDGAVTVEYDGDWQPVSGPGGVYRMTLSFGREGGLSTADIAVGRIDGAESIYEIKTAALDSPF